MSEVVKLIRELKLDLRDFYKEKRINERVGVLMRLFNPNEKDIKEMTEELGPLVDGLNRIAKQIYKE